MKTTQLGDLVAAGEYPAKMMKVLAVISAHLHPAYDATIGESGTGKDKCLFMSLAIRDFLVQIGFTDATVRGVALYIAAFGLDDKEIWSVGLGVPGQPDISEKFNGHAVCTVPSMNLLIDSTMYQAIRPAWAGAITGMMAVEYGPPRPNQIVHGRHGIAGIEMTSDDRRVDMIWLDRPELQWKKSDDFRIRNARRVAVTKALREAYGDFR